VFGVQCYEFIRTMRRAQRDDPSRNWSKRCRRRSRRPYSARADEVGLSWPMAAMLSSLNVRSQSSDVANIAEHQKLLNSA
jgi:hypothetical protein